ncbi:MAG TPA: ATP-binding protein [Xanthobacteraceae bacterium]|jgi:two-component system phosphate regulon sensor histidine kinase PhoR
MQKIANLPDMRQFDPIARELLEALNEPALLVERRIVQLANEAARDLLGNIEGSDVRLAIRQPQALEYVLKGDPGEIDFTGVGAFGRPWRLVARRVGADVLLLRLVDRSDAHAAEKLRVDFVANASHELRTPLTAVIGYAESLQEEGLEAEVAARFTATIRTEAERMYRIIEDLMSLSRIEADRFVAPSDQVDLAAMLRSAIQNVRGQAQECRCKLHLELQDDLPTIPGDFAQLAQVIDNLLSNAVRYGCASADCDIRLAAATEDGFMRLEVSDTGPGIPRHHLPFITRRFYRVDAARSREGGGTGLGLAIVKHIVERHRGTLSIDSELEKGTTVTVRLPLS